jgi:hypothetical protein
MMTLDTAASQDGDTSVFEDKNISVSVCAAFFYLLSPELFLHLLLISAPG